VLRFLNQVRHDLQLKLLFRSEAANRGGFKLHQSTRLNAAGNSGEKGMYMMLRLAGFTFWARCFENTSALRDRRYAVRHKSPKACAVLQVLPRRGLAASGGPQLRRWLGVTKKQYPGPTSNVVDGLLTEHE
jgi:hypothetical protein